MKKVRGKLLVREDFGLLLFELVVIANAKGHQEHLEFVLRHSESYGHDGEAAESESGQE